MGQVLLVYNSHFVPHTVAVKEVLRTMRLREVIGLSRNHISLLDFEPLESLDSLLIREKSSDSLPHRDQRTTS